MKQIKTIRITETSLGSVVEIRYSGNGCQTFIASGDKLLKYRKLVEQYGG